jgi:uncharacterized protein YjiS (DUF1127 family)
MSCGGSTSTSSNPIAFMPAESAPARSGWLLRFLVKIGIILMAARKRQAKIEFERVRQRTILATLDDRLLRDIGVTREEAMREAHKAFWK